MIHGHLGSCSLHPIPSSDWALLGYGLWPLYLAHVFLPCVCGLTGAPAMPLHSVGYNITYPFALLLLLGLQAKASTMSISYIIPSFVLTAQQTHFVPWASLAYFILLVSPISSCPTSITPMGFLLNPLGFLGPITIFLLFGLIGL